MCSRMSWPVETSYLRTLQMFHQYTYMYLPRRLSTTRTYQPRKRTLEWTGTDGSSERNTRLVGSGVLIPGIPEGVTPPPYREASTPWRG